MPATEQCVSMTIMLPKSLADQIAGLAGAERRSIDEEIRGLLERSLRETRSPRELLQIAREERAAELARAGHRPQTEEELWEQMHRIREEVANERYPG